MAEKKLKKNRAVYLAVERAGGQWNLADDLGITQGQVTHWATGRRPVPEHHAERIEELYGVPREKLNPSLKDA